MDVDTLFNIFKIAIDNEYKSNKFYKKAANDVVDPDAKMLFEDLANMELKHEELLKERYKALREKYSSEQA